MLERLIADGLAGRFPTEEVDIQDWKEMLKRAQDLQLKLRKRLNQRAARSAAPAMAEERGEESWALREKDRPYRAHLVQHDHSKQRPRPALPEGQYPDRYLLQVLAAKSATLTALERLEKARKELDEASRELLVALNLQGSATDLL